MHAQHTAKALNRLETTNNGLLVAACVTLVLLLGVCTPVAAEVYARMVEAVQIAQPPLSSWVAAAYPGMMIFAFVGVVALVVKERWIAPSKAALMNGIALSLALLIGLIMLAALIFPLLSMADSLAM